MSGAARQAAPDTPLLYVLAGEIELRGPRSVAGSLVLGARDALEPWSY